MGKRVFLSFLFSVFIVYYVFSRIGLVIKGELTVSPEMISKLAKAASRTKCFDDDILLRKLVDDKSMSVYGYMLVKRTSLLCGFKELNKSIINRTGCDAEDTLEDVQRRIASADSNATANPYFLANMWGDINGSAVSCTMYALKFRLPKAGNFFDMEELIEKNIEEPITRSNP